MTCGAGYGFDWHVHKPQRRGWGFCCAVGILLRSSQIQGMIAYLLPQCPLLETEAMAVELVPLTELFLTPSSILVGALGVARTEPLKTGISVLGLAASMLWIICSNDALVDDTTTRDFVLARLLPTLFIIC